MTVPSRRYRVLLVATHPVQYAAPTFRLLAGDERFDPLVAYCSLDGAERALDPDFGVEIQWDIPLLDGYRWIHVPNISQRLGMGRFLGLFNPGLWRLARRGSFDAIVAYTSYRHASFWTLVVAAKTGGTALLFGTDAHTLEPRDHKNWKLQLKCRAWPWLFRLADVVTVPSSATSALMRSLGIPAERIVLTPYVVHNEWWLRQAGSVNRTATRAQWGIPPDGLVVLFSAKLQTWKRPLDLLLAFARANVANAYLVFAGDGALRAALEAEAKRLGIVGRVRFLGFLNQSQLPAVYCSADLLVLPSEYEPFGVVVNEAMLCGLPVVTSDQVGAARDLIVTGRTGFVYPVGDVESLAGTLRTILTDQTLLHVMGAAARERIQSWSPERNVDALLGAVETAIALRGTSRRGTSQCSVP